MVRPREAGFGWAAPVVTGVLIVTIWHFGVRLSGVPESFLPSPGAVLMTLFEERAVLWESTLTTLVETLSGVLLAVTSALLWALALDRSRLLSDVTRVLSDQHVNILSAAVQTSRDRVATSRFTFEMGDPKHLGHVLKAVRGVEGVYDVYRVTSARNRT